jgi:hypothetical protein
MKNYLINLGLIGGLLVGCSTPPKPPTLKNEKYDIAINKTFYKQHKNKLSPNSDILKEFKNKSFVYEIYGYPINESSKIKFSFLATHSNSIKITANEKMINLYRNYLEEIGINSSNISSEIRVDKFDYVQFIFSGDKTK